MGQSLVVSEVKFRFLGYNILFLQKRFALQIISLLRAHAVMNLSIEMNDLRMVTGMSFTKQKCVIENDGSSTGTTESDRNIQELREKECDAVELFRRVL